MREKRTETLYLQHLFSASPCLFHRKAEHGKKPSQAQIVDQESKQGLGCSEGIRKLFQFAYAQVEQTVLLEKLSASRFVHGFEKRPLLPQQTGKAGTD